MNKKEMAISFLKMAGSGDVKNAYGRFVSPKFIHHNLHFKGDRKALMSAMEEAAKQSPNKKIEVKQIFEDGNSVITHSCVIRENPAEPQISVVHIFKFEDDRVVELWDIGQLIDKNSPNENGAF